MSFEEIAKVMNTGKTHIRYYQRTAIDKIVKSLNEQHPKLNITKEKVLNMLIEYYKNNL